MRIDTSKEGIEYAGVRLTDKQYKDLCSLNMFMNSRKSIPVFDILMVLKILGLLKEENQTENKYDPDSPSDNSVEYMQRAFGKAYDESELKAIEDTVKAFKDSYMV